MDIPIEILEKNGGFEENESNLIYFSGGIEKISSVW